MRWKVIAIASGAAIAAAVSIGLITRNVALTISVSYTALLIVVQFLPLSAFLLYEQMRHLWETRCARVQSFIVEPCTFISPKTLETSPSAILADANLFNAAKLKYLVIDTNTSAAKIVDELRIALFINILLLLALIVVISEGGQSSSQPTNIGQGANAALAATTESLRHLFSYTAVAVQLAWFARILFHYRQKNGELYAQMTAASAAAP